MTSGPVAANRLAPANTDPTDQPAQLRTAGARCPPTLHQAILRNVDGNPAQQKRGAIQTASLSVCRKAALCAQAKKQHTENLELLLGESLLRHDYGALPSILLALLANEVRRCL